MDTSKLDGDIMELLCRTCLKESEVQFNIFQHIQNNKLISDLIMECTPIKVQKDDGFPIKICNNCIDNLNSTCNFITMVVQSDVKLKKFYKSNTIDQQSQNNNEKIPSIKNEQIDLLDDSMTSSNLGDNKLIALKNDMYSSANGDNSHNRKNCDSIDLQNVQIKQESIIDISCGNDIEEETMFSTCEISDESITGRYANNFLSNSECQIAQEAAKNMGKKCDKGSQSEMLKEFEEKSENLVGNHERKPVNEAEAAAEKIPSDKLFIQVAKPCDECSNGLTTKLKHFSKRNINEKQAELLDNPDFKRIMEMNLSKKEKNRQTVFCEECNKTFTFPYFVGTHVHFHTGNLPFKCGKCALSFPKKAMLNQHLRSHETAKNFSCEKCGKAFRSIQHLKHHEIVHSSEKPYRCDICGKAFKYMLSLTIHIKIHNNEKNHVCEVCGKAFVDYNILRVHIMRHTVSVKNIECKICGKKFALKKDLDTHALRHSDKKPHVCNQCGKSFRERETLENHILIHTGEKPHACEICGKRFRQKSCIHRHMRVHTGETPYQCTLCTSAFKYKHHLQNHMKIHQK